MKDYTSDLKKYTNTLGEVLKKLDLESVSLLMNIMERARIKGNRIFVFGNGGSASTASHLTCDFNKGISYEQDIKYDIECLSDNVPMMMAIANDISYDDIFSIPLKNKLKEDDIVIGISGSGNSPNIIKAIEYANTVTDNTVAIVGYDGGNAKEIAKYCVHVNIDNMQIVEDVHLILNHMMMFILSDMKGC